MPLTDKCQQCCLCPAGLLNAASLCYWTGCLRDAMHAMTRATTALKGGRTIMKSPPTRRAAITRRQLARCSGRFNLEAFFKHLPSPRWRVLKCSGKCLRSRPRHRHSGQSVGRRWSRGCDQFLRHTSCLTATHHSLYQQPPQHRSSPAVGLPLTADRLAICT